MKKDVDFTKEDLQLKNVTSYEPYWMEKRLRMFEKYIHTNNCSDEGGWFAYFCPDGSAAESYDVMKGCGLLVNGCDCEEEAINVLIQTVCATAVGQ